MKTLVVASALLLGACAPGDLWTKAGGQPVYEWVGCHEVTQNPADNGEIAFGPFGVDTKYVFFKQLSADGTVGKVSTAKPCE